MLGERLTKALHDPAVNLSLMCERIEHRADILRSHKLAESDLARLRIDLYLGNLSTEGGHFNWYSWKVTASACKRNCTLLCCPSSECGQIQTYPASSDEVS